MTKQLPLPPRFFKCPELSEREVNYLVGKAKESAKALVDATRNNEGPVRWEEAGMHRGVQMYKGEARYPESVVGEAITYGCGATTIQSTLDEVSDFFDLSTATKVKEFVGFNPDMLDAQLLYVIQDPSVLNDPKSNARNNRSGFSKMLNANQVTVKWFVSEMPSKLLKNRDFLTVECQSTFMDVSGRRGWVRSYHSIKLPCCPELSDYNLVRGSVYHTGHVFVESERPGFLDVIYSAQVNMKGKVPTPLFMAIQKKRLSNIADLQRMITRRRLGAQRFLGDLELVPKSQRTRCNLCSTKFGLITRKARCRKCGEVVCSSACSTEWEVAIPGQGVRKVRVCVKCAQHTDPSVFEDIPASQQYSESNSAHEDEQEPPLMSVRAPGYQYERYNRSDTGSSPRTRNGRRQPGYSQPSLDSEEYDNGYRRQNSGRRGPYNDSYEESYSQSDSYQDPDPEYPRTVEMPINEYGGLSLDSDRYTNDSAEHDEYPPSSRRHREDSRKYDPRNPDMYDHETYGMSPPQHRDQEQRRALQRQQRALQQRQNKQRLLKRQQQQQEALMRRRQQQQAEEFDNYREDLEVSFSSSEFSQSNHSGASSDAQPSFLTSSLLAQHTEQSGKPGPVTKNERVAARRAVQQENAVQQERTGRKEPKHRLPPPAFPTDRPLTRLEQIQVQQWEQQEAMFKNQAALFDSELEPVEIPPSYVRRRRTGSSEGSGKRRGPELPSFFRSPHSSAHSQGQVALESNPAKLSANKVQAADKSGQRTVSVADDEDRLDNSAGREDSINGLAINFGSLLRPEDLRATEASICLSLDSTDLEQSIMEDVGAANPGKAGATDAKNRADVSKATVVRLYQQILELTNKKHELEARPESDPTERKEVARKLEELYEKLSAQAEM